MFRNYMLCDFSLGETNNTLTHSSVFENAPRRQESFLIPVERGLEGISCWVYLGNKLLNGGCFNCPEIMVSSYLDNWWVDSDSLYACATMPLRPSNCGPPS